MAKETQIKLTKTRYRLGCLGVTNKFDVRFARLSRIITRPDCDRFQQSCGLCWNAAEAATVV